MKEQEYKSLISKERYEEIKNAFVWDKEFEQINHYYFDDNDYIITNEITVRIREKSDSCKLQIKIPESIRSNIHVKNEFSMPFDRIPQFIDGETINNLCGLNIGDVHKLGTLKTERCTKKINDNVKLFLDKNDYLNITDYEVEIEYLNSVDEISDIVHELKLNESDVVYGKKTRFIRRLISNKNSAL